MDKVKSRKKHIKKLLKRNPTMIKAAQLIFAVRFYCFIYFFFKLKHVLDNELALKFFTRKLL